MKFYPEELSHNISLKDDVPANLVGHNFAVAKKSIYTALGKLKYNQIVPPKMILENGIDEWKNKIKLLG